MAGNVIEMYRDKNGQWRHRVKSRNGQVVGASEEGIKQFVYALRRAIRMFPKADVKVEDVKMGRSELLVHRKQAGV